MAFEVAGLGGTFAAGMLGGMQSAQRERELIASQREKEYLQTYQKLLLSGEWEPVDPSKGVSDGGVLKIGNVGMLKQKKQQADLEAQLRLEKLFGEVQAQKSKPPPSRTRSTMVDADGEPMVADRHQEYVNGEWVDVEVVPRLKEPRNVATYIMPNGKPVQVRSNEFPPEGSVPAPTFVSEANLGIRQREVSAETAEKEASEASKRTEKARDYTMYPADGEGVVAGWQNEFVEAYGERAAKIVKAEALKGGADEGEANRLAERARVEAKAEAKAKIPKPKKEGTGWLSGAYKWLKDIGGGAGDKAEAYKGSMAKIEAELARRAQQKQASPMVRKPIIKEDKQVVRKPIPPRPKTKHKKTSIKPPKFNVDKNGATVIK